MRRYDTTNAQVRPGRATSGPDPGRRRPRLPLGQIREEPAAAAPDEVLSAVARQLLLLRPEPVLRREPYDPLTADDATVDAARICVAVVLVGAQLATDRRQITVHVDGAGCTRHQHVQDGSAGDQHSDTATHRSSTRQPAAASAAAAATTFSSCCYKHRFWNLKTCFYTSINAQRLNVWVQSRLNPCPKEQQHQQTHVILIRTKHVCNQRACRVILSSEVPAPLKSLTFWRYTNQIIIIIIIITRPNRYWLRSKQATAALVPPL